MKTTTNFVKPRQLWSNPKVLMTATDLIVEGKYYPFAQTLGAYVEVVPAEKKAENQAATEPKKPVTFGSIMKGIGLAFLIIFLALFSFFLDNDYSGGGSNTLHRLVLNSDFGRTTVIQSTNRGKLNKIAQEVNQKLLEQGRRPVTPGFEGVPASR